MSNTRSTVGVRSADLPHEERAGLRQVLGIILPIFVRYKRRLGLGFCALVCVDIIQLMIPKILQVGVDSLAEGRAGDESLAVLGLYIVAAACAVFGFRFLWRFLIIGFSRTLEKLVRDRMMQHLLGMDQAFYDRKTTGDLIAHAGNDLSVVQMACGMGLVAAADAMFMSAAAIGFMAAINVKLTFFALLPMPVLAVCTKYLSVHLHHRYNRVQEQFSLLTEFVRSALVSIRLVQGYVLERFQEEKFRKLGETYVESNLRVAVIQGALFPISTLIGNIGMLFVLLIGGTLVISGSISIGEFVAFISYMYMLIWPIMAVGWVAGVAQRGLTSLRRIYTLLEQEPLVASTEYGGSPGQDGVCFAFRDLHFRYPDSARETLTGITVEITPGILGITGRTGSGKSTLCKLLLRLYPVKKGTLFCNGTDVNDLAVNGLRERIAYVPQEPVLFSDTIAENIRYGRKDAGDPEVREAARIAAVHEDIMEFTQGYDSIVGERGVKLSGGQKQRLALARALVSRRPILVLDDGLNAIDVETEQRVLKGILGCDYFTTVIIVSHRVNVLEAADRLLIMENGCITAHGTPEQVGANAFYAAMKKKQQNDA